VALNTITLTPKEILTSNPFVGSHPTWLTCLNAVGVLISSFVSFFFLSFFPPPLFFPIVFDPVFISICGTGD
jgi:hypothetical protein